MGTTNEHNQKRVDFALGRFIPDMEGVHPGAAIHLEFVTIGNHVTIKPLCAIGYSGFSFGFNAENIGTPIRHLGKVIIGDGVQVGAFTTICRSTTPEKPTTIEDHVKIDDHVHIAHNCHIMEKAVITAGSVIGGGVTIGPRAWIGINATILNGVTVGEYALIGAGAVVIKDVPPGAVMVGNPAKILKHR